MHERTFRKTKQIGIVLPDLDAAIKHYEDDFGVHPWQRAELDGAKPEEYGKPVERS